MNFEPSPTEEELKAYDCLEHVDCVPGDEQMTAFKKTARLHQAQWRDDKRLPMGTQPIQAKPGMKTRKLGSRIPFFEDEDKRLSNFLGDPIRTAVRHRVNNPEKYQTLKTDRLYCDLLSSMPMCFNLFGWFHGDSSGLQQAIRMLWPNAPGTVKEMRFEWSPGRRDPAYLGNQSAFDIALEFALPGDGKGVIGVETKYHEHCKAEKEPKGERRDRYAKVAKASKAFKPRALESILGKDLQQIWLDHLLVLSMLQHESGDWKWGKFVLVYPSKNSSYASAAHRYQALLADTATFEHRTLESRLDSKALPQEAEHAFRTRYLW